MTDSATPFNPDWVSPPGDTLLDIISDREWTRLELAQRLGVTETHLHQVLKGEVQLTVDMAIRLEQIIGSTANFWLKREARYRQFRAQLQAKA